MSEHLPHPDEFLSTEELEIITKLKKRFWEQRRITGDTPPFIRISARAVRYRWGDVAKWLDDRVRTSTADQGDGHNDGL